MTTLLNLNAAVQVMPVAAPRSTYQADPAPADVSFTQALNREIDDRRAANAPKTSKAPTKPADSSANASHAADNTTDSTADASAADADANPDAPKSAAAQAAADLLALVASVNASGSGSGSGSGSDSHLDTAIPSAALAVTPTALPLTAAVLASTLAAPLNSVAASTSASATMAALDSSAVATTALGVDKTLPMTPTVKPRAFSETLSEPASTAAAKVAAPGAATAAATDAAASPVSAVLQARAASVKATDLPLAKLSDSPNNNAAFNPALHQLAASATTQSAVASDKLTPPVGSPAWDQALGQKIVWMSNGGQQSATLTLNPPDLGPLQVVINVNKTQADATFIAANPEVKQALEAAMPKLREMLDQAGIQLGQANVSTGTPQQQQSFQQNAQNAQNSRNANGSQNTNTSDNNNTVASVSVSSTSGSGIVDTFV